MLIHKQKGFTIVELLIVIVVIGILAAITVVAYNGIQNRANNTVVQSDLRSSFNNLQQYYVVNGSYPSGTTLYTLLVVTRKSYGGGVNAWLFCRNDADVAIIGRSTSGQGYLYSSKGGPTTMTIWPGNGNADLCPVAGIPTTSSGYSNTWGYADGEWKPGFTPGA